MLIMFTKSSTARIAPFSNVYALFCTCRPNSVILLLCCHNSETKSGSIWQRRNILYLIQSGLKLLQLGFKEFQLIISSQQIICCLCFSLLQQISFGTGMKLPPHSILTCAKSTFRIMMSSIYHTLQTFGQAIFARNWRNKTVLKNVISLLGTKWFANYEIVLESSLGHHQHNIWAWCQVEKGLISSVGCSPGRKGRSFYNSFMTFKDKSLKEGE